MTLGRGYHNALVVDWLEGGSAFISVVAMTGVDKHYGFAFRFHRDSNGDWSIWEEMGGVREWLPLEEEASRAMEAAFRDYNIYDVYTS